MNNINNEDKKPLLKRKPLTKEERQMIYDKLGGRCAFCGEQITYDEMHVDHYLPHWWLQQHNNVINPNDLNNLLPSCFTCNHFKRGDRPEIFKDKISTIIKKLKNQYLVKVALKYGLVNFDNFGGKFFFEMTQKEREKKIMQQQKVQPIVAELESESNDEMVIKLVIKK